MRVESKVRYPIELKHDLGTIKLNAFNGNGIIGDGVTQVGADVWDSVYKNNHGFLDKCNRRGTITWSEFHVEKAQEAVSEEKPKKGGKRKPKVEETPVVEEEKVEETAPAESVEEPISEGQEAVNSALDIMGE